MMKTIPAPFQRQLVKMLLASIGIGVIGIGWGFTSKDRVTIILTFVLLLAYGLKGWTMARSIFRKQYEVMEGTIVSATVIPLHCQQKVVLLDTEQTAIRLNGRRHFVIGERYRLYVQRSEERVESPIVVPKTLLGYELISEQKAQ